MRLLCLLIFLFASFYLFAEDYEHEMLADLEKNDYVSALSLIKSKKIDINRRLLNGKLIADYIMFTNHKPTIELYLRSGMKPNPTGDNFYLNYVCLLSHTDTVKLLLDYGAPTEIWTDSYKTKDFGSPCIYFLISVSNDNASKYYIEKAIEQHGHAFLNDKLLNYIEKHKRATENIYEFIERQQLRSGK